MRKGPSPISVRDLKKASGFYAKRCVPNFNSQAFIDKIFDAFPAAFVSLALMPRKFYQLISSTRFPWFGSVSGAPEVTCSGCSLIDRDVVGAASIEIENEKSQNCPAIVGLNGLRRMMWREDVLQKLQEVGIGFSDAVRLPVISRSLRDLPSYFHIVPHPGLEVEVDPENRAGPRCNVCGRYTLKTAIMVHKGIEQSWQRHALFRLANINIPSYFCSEEFMTLVNDMKWKTLTFVPVL